MDEVSNGDVADDHQVEDERDPNDPVVDDSGYACRHAARGFNFQIAKASPWVDNLSQTKVDIRKESDGDGGPNTDASDDKEIEDEQDGEDEIV